MESDQENISLLVFESNHVQGFADLPSTLVAKGREMAYYPGLSDKNTCADKSDDLFESRHFN